MVRFCWNVEPSQSAWVPNKGMVVDEAAGVRHITIDMELAGQNETVMSLMTVPADYLDATKVSPIGVVLGHGADAEESWRGPLLEPLAAALAQQGHVVMRYHCPLKEQRRHRIFEKCFDVAATSPYAAPVRQWVFVGYDNGARIAAGVGAKVAGRAPLAGLAFLSYPLLQPAPPPTKQKAGAAPPADSTGALAKLNELRLPLLFVCGEFDRLCPGPKLKEVVGELLPTADARVATLEGLSGRYCVPGTKDLEEGTVSTVVQHVRAFVAALQDPAGLAACPLARMADFVPSERPLPDVPESPKREPSPEPEEEEEEEEEEPAPRRRGAAGRAAAPALAAAAAAGRPGLPAGMVPMMGPNGPMLVPAAAAAAMAANPQAAQQMQLQMAQMYQAALKQQAAAAAAGGAAAPNAALAQQQMMMQQMLIQQQMAAAAQAQAAARPAGGAAPAAAQAQAQQEQEPAPMEQ